MAGKFFGGSSPHFFSLKRYFYGTFFYVPFAILNALLMAFYPQYFQNTVLSQVFFTIAFFFTDVNVFALALVTLQAYVFLPSFLLCWLPPSHRIFPALLLSSDIIMFRTRKQMGRSGSNSGASNGVGSTPSNPTEDKNLDEKLSDVHLNEFLDSVGKDPERS